MIPRSILISTVAVAVIYMGVNLSIIGVVPWREFVPADQHPESNFIVSIFMERIYGSRDRDHLHADDPLDGVRVGLRAAARLLAHPLRGGAGRLLLQGVRPAARDGWLSRTSRCSCSGAISILACLFSLGIVIDGADRDAGFSCSSSGRSSA